MKTIGFWGSCALALGALALPALGGSVAIINPVNMDLDGTTGFTLSDGSKFDATRVDLDSTFKFDTDDFLIRATTAGQSYEVPVDAGYRAAFGSPRSFNITGESGTIRSSVDLSRVDKNDIYLRVRGVPETTTGGTFGGFLHKFDVKFKTTSGTETVIVSPPFNAGLGTETVYVDIPLSSLPSKVTKDLALGKITLDMSIGLSSAAEHDRLHSKVALVTKDPTIVGVSALNQFTAPGASKLYAQKQIDRFVARLPDTNPDKAKVITAQPNVKLGPVACQLTAFAMAFNTIGSGGGYTPGSLYDALNARAGGITEIDSVRSYRKDGTPRFNGADANWSMFQGLYGFDIDRVSSADVAAYNIGVGNPVLVKVSTSTGQHWMLAKEVTSDGSGLVFTGINPGNGAAFSKKASDIAGYIAVSDAGTPTTGTVITLSSPVTATITDPITGKKIVFDSYSGLTLDEFGGVEHTIFEPLADPDDYLAEPDVPMTDVPSHLANSIFLPGFFGDELQIDLLGKEAGDFHLDIAQFDGLGGGKDILSVGASIFAGETKSFTARFDGTTPPPEPPPTIVPLPAAVWAGLAMLSMLPLVRRTMNRREEA